MIYANARQTTADVAGHYDELDPFYRALWGEHVHHGLWTTGRETPEQAVAALSDLVAARLGLTANQALVDIGCGYGATARRFAVQHSANVTGLTLSEQQAARAPVTDHVEILVRDWLDNQLPDASFDGAYAIESSEHMEEKAGFFAEAYRVLKPGSRFVVCAWLAAENASSRAVTHLLEPICREGRMPSMGTGRDYEGLARQAGFDLVGFEDISRQVKRTWTICARRFLVSLLTDPATIRFLTNPQTRHRVFALSLPRLIWAYRTGAMRYGVFTWQKSATRPSAHARS